MFDAVRRRSSWRDGRWGTGAWISLAAHAGILAAVLVLGRPRPEPKEALEREVIFVPPRPPKGNPTPPAAVAQAPKPRRAPKPKPRLVAPRDIPPPPPTTEPAPPEPAVAEASADPALPYVPGGSPDGVETGGVAGAPSGEGPGGMAEEVIPFGAGMTPPELLTERGLHYTREALEAGVRGAVIARCIITREGDVDDCRLVKGIPLMNGPVLEALHARRYRPVTYRGRPVSVSYLFTVRLELP